MGGKSGHKNRDLKELVMVGLEKIERRQQGRIFMAIMGKQQDVESQPQSKKDSWVPSSLGYILAVLLLVSQLTSQSFIQLYKFKL